MAASATGRFVANDGLGWVLIASGADQLFATGKVEEGGGMMYYGQSAPNASSIGTSMRTGDVFSYALNAADGLWIKSGDRMVVTCQNRQS